MIFKDALKQLELGRRVKRRVWGYAAQAYLSLVDNNGAPVIYITNALWNAPPGSMMYPITYQDLKALDWQIIPGEQ